MNSSEKANNNVIPINPCFSTNAEGGPTMPEEQNLPSDVMVAGRLTDLQLFPPPAERIEALGLELQRVSAEINTAIREGFYVQMGVPELDYAPAIYLDPDKKPIYGIEIVGMKFNYQIQKQDPKRTITVDHRSEFEQRRSPDYSPPDTGEDNPTLLSD